MTSIFFRRRRLLLSLTLLGGGAAFVNARFLGENKAGVVFPAPPLNEQLFDGDLIFRRGVGFWSELSLSTSETARFSHCGIILRNEVNDFFVCHAEADDIGRGGVIAEPLDSFCRKSSFWEVFRLSMTNDERSRFLSTARPEKWKGVPFDTRLDISDRSAVYCSEFVWLCLSTALGIDPLPRKTVIAGREGVSVDDLLSSNVSMQSVARHSF